MIFSTGVNYFCNIPDVHRLLVEDIWQGFTLILDRRYKFRAFFGQFRCLCNRELLAQTDAKMMHFVTLMVPPSTDQSLPHNSSKGMSQGQKGLQVRFRENVHFEPFSWVIAHDFQHPVQFFCNLPNVHILLVEDIW
jgi:hypothetical protein